MYVAIMKRNIYTVCLYEIEVFVLNFKVKEPLLDGMVDMGGASSQIAAPLSASLDVGTPLKRSDVTAMSFMNFGKSDRLGKEGRSPPECDFPPEGKGADNCRAKLQKELTEEIPNALLGTEIIRNESIYWRNFTNSRNDSVLNNSWSKY
jgi:hypothetical protein